MHFSRTAKLKFSLGRLVDSYNEMGQKLSHTLPKPLPHFYPITCYLFNDFHIAHQIFRGTLQIVRNHSLHVPKIQAGM